MGRPVDRFSLALRPAREGVPSPARLLPAPSAGRSHAVAARCRLRAHRRATARRARGSSPVGGPAEPRGAAGTSHMAIRVALHHRTRYRYDRRVHAGAAGRPAAAGAALPHADPELRAAGRARGRTSSTGSRTRRATTWRASSFPKPTRELGDRGRPGRRDDGHQPVRLLPRAGGRDASRSPTTPCAGRGAGAVPRAASRPGRGCARWLDGLSRGAAAHDRLPGRR